MRAFAAGLILAQVHGTTGKLPQLPAPHGPAHPVPAHGPTRPGPQAPHTHHAPQPPRVARSTVPTIPRPAPALPSAPAPHAEAGDAAMRYGNMTHDACILEATMRKLPVKLEGDLRGVLVPLRLQGPLSGVSFHSAIPESQRQTSVFEVFDCRLVLAMDDYAKMLAAYDVVEVIHMSAYRPPPAKGWKDGDLGSRHSGALAIDVGAYIKKDGSKLVVEKDYHGYIGQGPCNAQGEPNAPWPQSAEGTELRKLTCDTLSAKLFHVVLTPGFNWAHHNHFHLEVSAGGTHYYVR